MESSDNAFLDAETGNEISDFDFPEKQSEEELRKELAKTEEEIQTLRTVLTAKIKHSNELKRKLGITVWKEFRDEVENSFRNIQETSAYQKTSDAVKMSQQSVIGTLGSVARKLGEVKNTNAFKSFEEKVGYAVTNVKSKIASRSNSTTNFDDALKNSEKNGAHTPVSTPTIPENNQLG
ncbi:Tumor protein D52 [Sarcoptes scabiei]|uniref:Tumor protein D52 n=1 Tax=Sarcoptes scabiei TaxID=52283 RepID=A0A834RC33_SARSC|nr:Tumor protein D52 [Sarcoptes scabiei]UXI21397.1 hypothetical protein NH340_JMT07340 [Sarcoptes scabiei]